MIVPEIAGGAAPELDNLRAACDSAVRQLADAGVPLIVLGSSASTIDYESPARVSLSSWGQPGGVVADPLPLSLSVGAWLVNRVLGQTISPRMVTIAADASAEECAALAGRLATGPYALLVMGDGTACRGIKSPGYDDPRAQPYDESVARALAVADVDALLALDPDLSAKLMVAGRAPWQVLAHAAAGGSWRGSLAYEDAPYGVAYFVASWERA